MRRLTFRTSFLLFYFLLLTAILVFLVGFFNGKRPQLRRTVTEVETELEQSVGSVLVLGVGTFVGFHVARALALRQNTTVFGQVDLRRCRKCDFELKRDRTFQLYRLGIALHYADICEGQFLAQLVEQNGVLLVVHAAEEGDATFESDGVDVKEVGCFVSFIEELAKMKGVRVVHVTSFITLGDTSHYSPQSHAQHFHLWGRHVRERLLTTYCKTTNISAVTLDVFNAYGMWGRYNTIMHLLSQEKMHKEMEHTRTSAYRRIWLTSIDDIIGTVLKVIQYRSISCGQTLVVQPTYHVSLDQTRDLILSYHGTHTASSVTHEQLSGFVQSQSVTSLEEDLKIYSVWLNAYERSSHEILSVVGHTPSQQFAERLSDERNNRLTDEKNAFPARRNMQLKQQLREIQQKFVVFAKKTNVTLPQISKEKFIFYAGRDSPHYDIMRLPSLQNNVKLLMERCKQVDQCVAFNTKGFLKKRVADRKKWKELGGDGDGLYVADIDMCRADLHSCSRHSKCHATGAARFMCSCDDGYWGSNCIPRYEALGLRTKLEEKEKQIDENNGIDWTELKKKAKFVFFPGMDSPGGDYLVAEQFKGNADKLKTACLRTRRCLAFNTNGILKSSLQWSSRWMQWTDSLTHGLYVLDLDYCSLDEMECPEHSRCQKLGAANYSCLCARDLLMITQDLKDMCKPIDGRWTDGQTVTSRLVRMSHDDFVHIIMSADVEHWRGLAVAIRSILINSVAPDGIRFHVVVVGETADSLRHFLSCSGIQLKDQLDIHQLDKLWFAQQNVDINVYANSKIVGNLASKANFARFYFHKFFPRVKKALYVDVDVVVQRDIRQLWEAAVKSNAVFAAVKRKSPLYGTFFHKPVKDIFQERYRYVFHSLDPTFNAGVYAVDLFLWEEKNILNEVHFWMKQNSEQQLWAYGTQPILLLALHKQWTGLPSEWNIQGLGYNTDLASDQLDNGALLHWSGRRKPWLEDGLYKDYWLKYTNECSGHGRCARSKTDGGGRLWSCHCQSGLSGEICDRRL